MNGPDLTLLQARRALLDGTLGCVEYVDSLLKHAEGSRQLNIWTFQDIEALRQAARKADATQAARNPDLLLAGIPLALKDNINTLDLPTSAGTPGLRTHRPKANAPVADLLFKAGALLAGKTNMHELAFGITSNNAATGPVRNPWNPELIAGGSSGGSAAAVAAAIVPGAIGTDTGGSVRLPAALCGIAGLRPTVGRYPGAGIVPISHTRDTAGPLARDIHDLALLDQVMSGCSNALAKIGLDAIRLGIPRKDFHGNLDEGVKRVTEQSLAILASAGVTLVEVDIENLAALNDAVGFPVVLYEVMRDLPAYLEQNECGITIQQLIAQVASPDVAGLLAAQLGDTAMPGHAYESALRVRPRLQAAYAECFSRHRLDAIVFPTSVLPACPIGQDETVLLNGQQVPTFMTYIRNTDPGSNAGIPGTSLPAGLTGSGLPVGLELDGPAHSDRHLLAVAAAIQTVLLPPKMPSLA